MRGLQTWEDIERLYLRHSQSVYRRARMLLADDEAARDTTHEVFVRALGAGEKVPAAPTPTAWLHSVTTNLCLNQLRDRKRHHNLLALNYAPGTQAPNSETRATLLQILGRVPEDLQEIAVYFLLDELTYDEIARLLGVSRRTVCNRLATFRDLVEGMFPNMRRAS